MAVAVKHGDIVDKYFQVVPGAGTLADAFLDTIENSIEGQQLAVRLIRESATAGMFGGIRGVKRPVLLAEPTDSALQDFTLYLFGVPNGINLAAGWYLTEAGRGNKNIAGKLGSLGGGVLGAAASMHDVLRNLNIFDMADLAAIVTAIHQFSVMEAVYAIATRVGFDQSRIASQSSGFFGIG